MELNGPAFPVRKLLVIAFLGISQWYSSCIPLKSPFSVGISNDFPNKTHHPLVKIVLTSLWLRSQPGFHCTAHCIPSSSDSSTDIDWARGLKKTSMAFLDLNVGPLGSWKWKYWFSRVFHKWPLGSPFSQIIAHWKWNLRAIELGQWEHHEKPTMKTAVWKTSMKKTWWKPWCCFKKHDENPWTDETMVFFLCGWPQPFDDPMIRWCWSTKRWIIPDGHV